MTDITTTLTQRGQRYGDFTGQSKITQDIKRAMRQGNWPDLSDPQRECLEMLAVKISRILNGDPDYHDNWHDIIGYTTLVAETINRNPNQK